MEPGLVLLLLLLLLGIAAAASAGGTSSLGIDILRSSRARAHEQPELAATAAADTRSRPGQQGQEATCPAYGAPKPPRRTRRCTCYTYKDKECIYYCHLDIIWINTPERTVPYGVSSYRGEQRVRRSGGGMDRSPQCLEPQRCSCRDPADSECRGFCRSRLLEPVDQADSTSSQRTSVQPYPTLHFPPS